MDVGSVLVARVGVGEEVGFSFGLVFAFVVFGGCRRVGGSGETFVFFGFGNGFVEVGYDYACCHKNGVRVGL